MHMSIHSDPRAKLRGALAYELILKARGVGESRCTEACDGRGRRLDRQRLLRRAHVASSASCMPSACRSYVDVHVHIEDVCIDTCSDKCAGMRFETRAHTRMFRSSLSRDAAASSRVDAASLMVFGGAIGDHEVNW